MKNFYAFLVLVAMIALSAVTVQAGTYDQVILGDSPTAYWRLDDASSANGATAADATGHGYNNIYYSNAGATGGPVFIPGISGQAVLLNPNDGSGDAVLNPGNLPVGQSITVEAWARSNTGNWNDNGLIASSRTANGFIIHPDYNAKSWGGYIVNSSGTFSNIGSHTPADIMDWHHYAITYDGTTGAAKMFFDGQSVASTTMSVARSPAATIGADFGHDYGYGGRFGNVRLDEPAVYASALSDAQVLAHYNAGRASYLQTMGAAVFTGAADPNVDFSGHFAYGVNLGYAALNAHWKVGSADFRGETAPGVTLVSGNGAINPWNPVPEYGSSTDDNNLETVMSAIRYGSGSGNVALDLNVLPGQTYKLQMLLSDVDVPYDRHFNVYVDGQKIADELDVPPLIGHLNSGDTPTKGLVLTKTFTATSNKVHIVADRGTIGPNNDPILNAVTLESTPNLRTFHNAADLALAGQFLYAVNFGYADLNATWKVGDATFRGETQPGVHLHGGNWINPWNPKPEYGSTADDNNLEAVMSMIRYTNDFNVDLDIVPGTKYRLQLLFSDLAAAGVRPFDVLIDGASVLNEVDMAALMTPWSNNPTSGVAFAYDFLATNTTMNIRFMGGQTGSNGDAIINALTLEIIPEPATMAMLALAGAGLARYVRRRR